MSKAPKVCPKRGHSKQATEHKIFFAGLDYGMNGIYFNELVEHFCGTKSKTLDRILPQV
jgi:hypothetical protein